MLKKGESRRRSENEVEGGEESQRKGWIREERSREAG